MALKAKPLGRMSSAKLDEAIREVTKEAQERLNVNVPRGLYKAMKMKAMTEDTSISELVNKWIAEYVGSDAKE